MASENSKRRAFVAITAALSLGLSCAMLEVGLRVRSRVDVDGNVFLGSGRLYPFHLPIERARELAQLYEARGERTYFVYDSDLGWTVRPNGSSDDGLYHANERGVRVGEARRPTSLRPAAGVYRIALFGDSFTHANDVPFEQTWGHVLGEALRERGVRAEVLNLGGSGYAMNQALLRFRKEGRALSPHLVVFGFQRTNVLRNLNLIRLIYNPDSGLIFANPRFVLEGDALRQINWPAPRPAEIPALLADFPSWEFAPYEFFYQPEHYRDRSVFAFRSVALVSAWLFADFTHKRKDYDFFAPRSEARRLARAILDAFELETEAIGAELLVVNLPTRKPLKRLLRDRELKYQDLWAEIARDFQAVDPGPELVALARREGLDTLFAPVGGHYSGSSNAVIGRAVAAAVEPLATRR